MPRIQTYLPDDLYREVKARDLPASELLQKAIRAELRRLELLDAVDRYLDELHAEVGDPTADEASWAESVVDFIEGTIDEVPAFPRVGAARQAS